MGFKSAVRIFLFSNSNFCGNIEPMSFLFWSKEPLEYCFSIVCILVSPFLKVSKISFFLPSFISFSKA